MEENERNQPINDNIVVKLCIVDADSLIYIHCYKNKDSNLLDDYIKTLDDHIAEIFKQTQSTKYMMFLTESRTGTFRHKLAVTREYKGNRSKKQKPKFFYDLKNHLINRWDAYSYPVLEADDLCHITKKQINQANPLCEVVIASPDKDLRQKEGEYYDYKNMVQVDITNEDALYNFYTQMITGDSTDNIECIKGQGKVAAEKMLSNVDSSAYMHTVLQAYINQYGLKEGINKFTESFNLLYLLEEFKADDFKLPMWKDVKITNVVQNDSSF